MKNNVFDYEEIFQSESQEEINKEMEKKRALMSLFPKQLGTIDNTKYILLNDNKKTQENYNKVAEGSNEEINRFPKLGNNGNLSNLVIKEIEKPNVNNEWLTKNALKGLENTEHKHFVKSSWNPDSINMGNKSDSLWYNKGHLNVTFKNDVLNTDDFDPFDSNDRTGCKRRCVTMLRRAGCELSGERIDMTINNINGEAISPSSDFQHGISAINKALNNKQPIILNVDYKKGTASSADKAGDHFIIVTGKTTINGVTYYHFYDPATSIPSLGTASSNVLYIKNGFLTGEFWRYDGKPNRYKVTSVRLNK